MTKQRLYPSLKCAAPMNYYSPLPFCLKFMIEIPAWRQLLPSSAAYSHGVPLCLRNFLLQKLLVIRAREGAFSPDSSRMINYLCETALQHWACQASLGPIINPQGLPRGIRLEAKGIKWNPLQFQKSASPRFRTKFSLHSESPVLPFCPNNVTLHYRPSLQR